VRLACVKRAASVDSEPGSNSRLILLRLDLTLKNGPSRDRPGLTQSSDEFTFASNQIVKDLRSQPCDPKKTESTAGLESRFGASDTYIQSFRLNQNSWELKKNYLTGVEA
jgi:hypothetical protein